MTFDLASVMQNPRDKKKDFAVILTSAKIKLTPNFAASDSTAASNALPTPLPCAFG